MDREHQANCVQLITSVQQRLHAYILTMLPRSSAADDILQETNLVMWKKIDSYEPGTNFNAWAYKIAYFQTLSYVKKAKRHEWLRFDTELMETLADEIEEEFESFDEENSTLRRCIDKLSEADRKFVIQRYYDEMSLKELAELVGRSVGALKQVMFRIRGSLKTCIQNTMALEDAPHGV
jgi:RNA polymerase sigma-70 factor (ECF subfamily)